MQVKYTKNAAKFIKGLDIPTRQRIKKAVDGLTLTQPQGDIKMLQGYTDGRKRLQLGKYRIVYTHLSDAKINILSIMNMELIEILPEQDQTSEFIKKLVLAWDPDYTKVTPRERKELDEATSDPETISQEDIDWG